MMSRKIGLVVFDLGRVMVRLCDGWRHACDRASVPYQDCLDQAETKAKVHELVVAHETGRLDDAAWAAEMSRVTRLSPEHVGSVLSVWLDGPYPGWDGVLDELERAGVRTACLSNTNPLHWGMMTTAGGPHAPPLHRLTHLFGSHLIGAHKPDPAIYRHVERETGIDPRSILFFDDAPANVEGARACGWSAEIIEHPGDPVTQVREHLGGYGVL